MVMGFVGTFEQYYLKLKGKHCQKFHCRNGVVDHLGLWLYYIHFGAVAVALGIKDKVIYHKNRLYGTKEI